MRDAFEKTALILETSRLDDDFKSHYSDYLKRERSRDQVKNFFLVSFVAFLVFLLYLNAVNPPVSSYSVPDSDEASSIEDVELRDPDRGRNKTKLPVSHAFVNSVYYYPTSKSLGANAIAMTMAIDHRSTDLSAHKFTIIGSNETSTVKSTATSAIEGIGSCRYTTLMANTNTVENLKKLEIEGEDGVKVEIPFKMARYSSPSPVIICISPQFVAEQWQMFLMHVHTAHRFGGHLHVYITSMVSGYFELMREYERHGYMTLDLWVRMRFRHSHTPFFEPNANVEWRNQAGAQTDCLLQYKEAASYIAFFDMDDILFPKTHPTYLEEFNAEWALFPDSNSMFYGRREHEFIKADSLDSFNFHELVGSLKSSKLVKRGKVVVRPDRYNSTWIHYSKHDTKSHKVTSPNLVHVQRPIQKHGENNMTIHWKMEFGPLNETIRPEDVDAIEEDVNRMRNLSIINEISKSLPSTDFYLPIVFECYYKAFYGPAFDHQKGGIGCPNADFCELPQREDYKCVHSEADYHSGPHMQPVTFHWISERRWSWDIGCYQ